MMTAIPRATLRLIDIGHKTELIFLPLALILSLFFYEKISEVISPLGVDTQVLFSYALNVLSIEFGALISLFTFMACRPTQFLERIRNTTAFKRLISYVKITLCMMAVCIGVVFALGILKLEPGKSLDIFSIIFAIWFTILVATTVLYTRAVRLIFLALT